MEQMEAYVQKKQWTKYVLCIVGAFIYSVGMNAFVASMGLYAGGVMGISQIIQTVLVEKLGVNLGGFNLSAVLYSLLNVPLFIMAMRSISD